MEAILWLVIILLGIVLFSIGCLVGYQKSELRKHTRFMGEENEERNR